MLTKLNEICFADEITPWWSPSDEIIALRWLIFSFEKIWLAQVDSNHRPRAYQARALTTWAMSQYIAFGSDICSAGEITSWWNPYGWNPHFVRVLKDRLVEMMGFEPMTPCLQGRCSPSWATPPYIAFGSDICSAGEITSWWYRFAVIYCFAMLGFCCFSNLFALTLHLSYPSMPSIA